MCRLVIICFWVFAWTLNAGAVDSFVTPVVWQPSSNHARYILPSVRGDSAGSQVRHYLYGIQQRPGLREYVPIREWLELSQRIRPQLLEPYSSSLDRPRAIILANSLSDHQPASVHLRETMTAYTNNGWDVYVLPLAAVARLAPETQRQFYRSLSKYFRLTIGLGGKDLAPSTYGAELTYAVDFNADRDHWLLHAVKGLHVETRIPYLGICLGAQQVAAAFGCKLHQDLFHELHTDLNHQGGDEHPIILRETSTNLLQRLYEAPTGNEVTSRSFHHQMMIIPPNHPYLEIAALAPDGVTEAVTSRDGRYLLMQPHPEKPDSAGAGARLLKNCAALLR